MKNITNLIFVFALFIFLPKGHSESELIDSNNFIKESDLSSAIEINNLPCSGNDNTFEKIFTLEDDWLVKDVIEKEDCGFFVFGTQGNVNDDNRDFFILKTDEFGNEIWLKNYGGNLDNYATHILPADNNGNYLIGNTEISNTAFSPEEATISKIDENGNEIWINYYPDFIARNAIITNSGDLLIFGESMQSPNTAGMYLIGSDGQVIESHIIQGNPMFGGGQQIIESSDGSYFLFHEATSSVSGNIKGHIILTKLDEDKNLLWRDTSINANFSSFNLVDIELLADDKMVLLFSRSDIYGPPPYATYSTVTYDTDGSISNSFNICVETKSRFYDLERRTDGSFLYAGSICNQIYYVGGVALCTSVNPILKSDSDSCSWQQSYFDINNLAAHAVKSTSDGGFVLAGVTDDKLYLVKANEEGTLNLNCPDQIPGFTAIGEFENSKYFISNDNAQPAAAQMVAAQNGGFLASINSQAENDFLQQNISEMTYIGLNDVEVEGNLVWGNGDPLNYNNINTCGFCNENSDDFDYVIMAPWNGAWSFSSLWNERKYILEVPCNNSSGEFEITYDCPTEFPQSGIWEVPVTLTNNTSDPSNPFFLSLYLEGNGTGPNPQSTFATITAPILQAGESVNIILEADLLNISQYLPNRKTFPDYYISEFTYGDFYISRSATVPQPTVPFDFYCKKYETDLAVAIQNPTPEFMPNNEVIYTVEVTNNGNEDAYNIQTQLLKSVATSYSGAPNLTVDYSAEINNLSQGSWQRLSGGNYVWYLSQLGVGETATVEVIYHLDDPLEYGTDLPSTVTVDVSVASGHLIDSDESNNTDSFVFEKGNSGGGDCPDAITGFTSLGEFGDSKYFISNNASQPIDAQLVAQQNNGYLAVINDQVENDFLQQNISEMTYIGLNDVSSEGNLVWENGDPLNYNNINPCSFCNENSEEQDYVIMAPWNGTWSFSSIWNSRKYIVEIPCSGNPMPTDFCGFLNHYPISSTENFQEYSIEETSNGLSLITITQEDLGNNNNAIFEKTSINSDGQATGMTSLILPVNNKSKLGDFGYQLEEISPTQLNISSVNSNGGNNWENILNINTNDNNIDELVSVEVKEMEDHLLIVGSYHFGGTSTPTWRPFLIKTDLNGNEIWQNLLDVVTGFPDFFLNEEATSGGYYLNMGDVSESKNFLIKTDETGNVIWSSLVTQIANAEYVVFGGESPDGSGVILGVHSNNTNNGEIIKYDINTGTKNWTRNLSSLLPGGQGTVAQGINGIIATSDGGAVFIANFLSYSLMTSIYIYGRLDSDGNELWHYKIPDELRNHQATLETLDGGLVFSKYNEDNHTVDLFKTNNNGLFDPVCNVDIFVDLSLSNLRGWSGGTLANGEAESIEFKIHNNALADAENYVVKAYLSTDNLLSANDILVTSFGYSNTPFGVHEAAETFQIPLVPEAEYRLLLEVDGNQTIAETDENNNVLILSEKRLITGGPLLELPDFRPGFLDIGGNFGLETPPGDYEYTFDLSNVGNVPSVGGMAKIFLSEDTNWSADDILIGEKLIGNVPVGSSSLQDVTINVTITNNISEGLYRLILVIDAGDEILEFDELNNETTGGITVISNGNCPTDLPGFDFLGEYENAKYFISQDVAQPIAAQAIAASNGGYLTTIKSSAENDFVFSQIDEMVYIGLNDFNMEDSYEWFNSQTVSYVNFDICSFCNENSAEMDFVVMHDWNGKWSWSNFYNSRKYIVEIPCSSTLTDPSFNNSLMVQIPNQLDLGELMIEKLHPNPAMDFIFTTIQSPVDQEVEVQIFDARGALMKNVTIQLQKGGNRNRISISELPSGFYSAYIPNAQGKNSTKRFVKVRD